MRDAQVGRAAPQDAGTFDYVIVGAGSAGCVLANRLTKDPSVRVLLLEAKSKDNYIWLHVPIGYYFTFGNPRVDWCFTTEPEPGLGGRQIKYPRGKVLGGCSSINAMVYIRGQAADYDRWRDTGNPGWGWDEVLPYFKRSEDYSKGANAFHGAGGELAVEPIGESWEILDAFEKACIETGLEPTDDFNKGDSEGVGRFDLTRRNGLRWSTARAFLRPALERPNLKVLTGAHVQRLTFEGQRCTGVEFRQEGATFAAKAAGEVILSSGAVGSPQTLSCSGIGPAARLRDLGIPVVADLPGVGENLQDHVALRMLFKVKDTITLNQQAATLFGKAKMALQYALLRKGPLTIPPALVSAFTRSSPDQATPNVQFVAYPVSFDKVGDAPHPYPGFTASACLLNPFSRGHVRIASPDPMAAPKIQLNFLTDERDLDIAAGAMRAVRRAISGPALARFAPQEMQPGVTAQTDDELKDAARRYGMTIFHPVGTCRMGNDANAVVDARLRVHGIGGLRVVDASVMPTITSGNTNAPTIMIAEKAADMILQDRRSAA